MAYVTIKLTLAEALEVKQILTETKQLREQVLTSAPMKREYESRENGPAEWKHLQERYALLDSALRNMA